MRVTKNWKHNRKDRHQYEYKGNALSKWVTYDDGYVEAVARWEPINRNKRNTPFMQEEYLLDEDT